MIYGRTPQKLIGLWIIALSILGALYLLKRLMPALSEMLVPVYWIVALCAALLTWRWLRTREKTDRRGGDRRRLERRNDNPPASGD